MMTREEHAIDEFRFRDSALLREKWAKWQEDPVFSLALQALLNATAAMSSGPGAPDSSAAATQRTIAGIHYARAFFLRLGDPITEQETVPSKETHVKSPTTGEWIRDPMTGEPLAKDDLPDYLNHFDPSGVPMPPPPRSPASLPPQ